MEARRTRLAAYTLFAVSVFFYFLAFFNPYGTDFTSRFYLSVAAGLFTSSLVVVVTTWIRIGGAAK